PRRALPHGRLRPPHPRAGGRRPLAHAALVGAAPAPLAPRHHARLRRAHRARRGAPRPRPPRRGADVRRGDDGQRRRLPRPPRGGGAGRPADARRGAGRRARRPLGRPRRQRRRPRPRPRPPHPRHPRARGHRTAPPGSHRRRRLTLHPMRTVTLGVVTKLWSRPAVAEFVMRYFARLTLDGVRLECVAVASPGDRHEPAPVDGWRRVYAPNRPLSHKGNHAARTLEGRVDAVLNIGSDDVCSPAYIEAAVNAIRGGADYVVPEGLCLWDLATGRSMEVDAPRIGAGRVLSARLLDTLRWHPWPVRGNVPDADMDERLRQH